MSTSDRERAHPSVASRPAAQTWAILAGLLLVLSAVTVLFALDYPGMQGVRKDAMLINVAGRQRMLSQQLAKTAARTQWAISAGEVGPLPQETATTLQRWKASHEALRRRDPKGDLGGANSPESNALFDALEPHYRAILEAGETLARGQVDEDGRVSPSAFPPCQQILDHEAAYLAGMDAIVTSYQRAAERRAGSSQRSKIAAMLVAWAALVTLGFSVVRRTNQLERANLALRRSRERYALVVRASSEGIWDWNLLTDEVYISPRFRELLGYQEHELGSRFAAFESIMHPEDRERVLAALRDHLERRVPYDAECRLRIKSGLYRRFAARGQAMWDDTGKPTRMVGSVRDVTEQREAERKLRTQEAELLAAQRVQSKLLPQKSPVVPGLDIAGAVHPAASAGGDYFDYLQLCDGGLGVVVGDVSGHSLSSALLAAATSAHIRSNAEVYSGIDDILVHANGLLCKETDGESFVTLCLLRIDPRLRFLHYVNAGHPSGYVFGASGELKSLLHSKSLPLAVMPDTEFPVGGPVNLAAGDMILLVSDGVLEAQSPEGQAFGAERLMQVVRDRRSDGAREIIAHVHRAVCEFTQRDQTVDDITAVALKLKTR